MKSKLVQADYKLPILHILKNSGGSSTVSEVYEKIKPLMGLSPEKFPDQFKYRKSGEGKKKEIIWQNNTRYARLTLKNEGLLYGPKKGVWAITDEGRKALENSGFIGNEFPEKSSKSNKPETETIKMEIKEVIHYAYNYITSKGFRYQFEEIANFYLSIKTKPFVILAGISGTGKTQLPRKFAEAIGMDINDQVIQLPVRPDWTDGSDLLGYTALDGKFIPKDLTSAIQKAKANKKKPIFFLLDEMNLARVEHYFSEFLSIIETRKWENGSITTDPILRDEMIKRAENASEFEELHWPENLFLIGTVNMDETTHAFSRKVLDRANTIEMNEVDLNWINTPDKVTNPLERINESIFKSEFLSSIDLSQEEKNSIDYEIELLIRINDLLQKADLHFAYRVRDEIAFYLILNKREKLMEEKTAMDFQLVQKILPRIHGSSERVQKVLVDLYNLLESEDFSSENLDFPEMEKKHTSKELKYPRASKKIIFMLKRFEDDRFTSFWL